jgi:hypothetical protein
MRRGQGVLNILPIGGVKENLDAALAPERPDLGSTAAATRVAL